VLNRFPNYKNTDYVTVSSPSVIWAYEEAMDLDKEVILPIGVSRTDIFFDKSYREKAFQKLHEIFPESIGKKVILYAPTFRGDMRDAKAPDALDLSVYASDLQDEYVFLIKHHPFSRQIPDVPAEYQSFAREVTQQMSIDECLWVSDMCISDYSSLIFEYSLFERPMIFFAYDRQDYMDWRGFYYPYEEFTPGPVCISNEEVLGAILELQQEFDKTQVRQFREKFMSSCDGHSTERILNLLEDV
jgi:CDP-glycerol glycerophosphotransferase (TagB/SpsB family)